PLPASSTCDDADDCTLDDTCIAGACVGATRDDDADGFASIACGGLDCDDDAAGIHPDAPENQATTNCDDGIDNDCDATKDDLDPTCGNQVCNSDGWCWLYPRAFGSVIRGGYGLAADDVWLVGELGTAIHWDGASFEQHPTGTTVTLRGVWGAATNDVVAVGDDGTILRWDGGAWTAEADADVPTDVHLFAVTGTSASAVWAVGNAGTILFSSGGAWVAETSNVVAPLRAIAVGPGGEAWAVGDSSTVTHRSGGVWAPANSGVVSTALVSVHRFTDGTVWTFGSSYFAASWNGSGWVDLPEPSPFRIVYVVGDTPNDVWLGSTFNAAPLHWNGSDVDIATALPNGDTLGLLIEAGSDLWALADRGELWVRRAAAWEQAHEALPVEGFGVTGAFARTAEDLWLVGGNGLVVHWNGKHWAYEIVDDARCDLDGVWAASADDVWLVGYDGTHGCVLRRTGGGWTRVYEPAGHHLRAIHGLSAGGIYVVSDDRGTNPITGALHRFDGATWTKVVQRNSPTWSVFAISDALVVMGGSNGASAWNGVQLTNLLGGTLRVNAIYAASPTQVFLAGRGPIGDPAGTVWLWNGGTSPTVELQGLPVAINGIHGTSASSYWIGLADGTTRYWNGGTWETSAGLENRLTTITGSGSTVFAVGGGVSLHQP
ncbi:MAG TPA: hypothetical protein VLC93_11435, partial [Myxococcota bacterium]|nr:hypothetical protein [Myxococcota bacterium]